MDARYRECVNLRTVNSERFDNASGVALNSAATCSRKSSIVAQRFSTTAEKKLLFDAILACTTASLSCAHKHQDDVKLSKMFACCSERAPASSRRSSRVSHSKVFFRLPIFVNESQIPRNYTSQLCSAFSYTRWLVWLCECWALACHRAVTRILSDRESHNNTSTSRHPKFLLSLA